MDKELAEALARRDQLEWDTYDAMALYEAAHRAIQRRFGVEPALDPSAIGRCAGQRLRAIEAAHEAYGRWLAAVSALSEADRAARKRAASDAEHAP